jgi:large subunit ribosomal protein L7/L12
MASKSYEKLIDQIGELSVIELAEMVTALKEKFNISDMPVAVAGAAAASEAAPAAAEKAEYKVTLDEMGSEMIKVIKAVKTLTGMSLGEAKKAVQEAPTVLAEAAPKEDAQKMKEALEAAGAKVTLG